jgi:choline dehydrogenase
MSVESIRIVSNLCDSIQPTGSMSLGKQKSDYIIIGAGSAGSVLANRLSDASTVTVLEAGPNDHALDFRLHMPAALSHVLANDRYNWYYHSEPEAGLNNRSLYCPRGRVLGGSSSINGMIYIRGNAADFDGWAKIPGLESWSFEKCLSYFKRAEACRHGASDVRGKDGPLHIGRLAAETPLFKAWLEAGEQAGFGATPDFNGKQQDGVGVYDSTIKSGRRFSTARAYLHPALNRDGLSVVKKALVTKIIFDGTRAVGVQYAVGRQIHTVYAEREVILCGGAINSPQLLMLSGVGAESELSSLNIPIVAKLPGVGKNLQDHLELYIQYHCKKPVSLFPALKWFNQPGIGLKWYLTGRGAGASNHFETGAFLRSSDSILYPDLQYHFLPIAMNYDGSDKYNDHGFQVHVGPMKPTSRGSINLVSNDPSEPPRISFNYNSTRDDRSVMRQGIRFAREIVSQAAFDEFRGVELKPGKDCITDAELDEFVRSHGESAYHPSCTCRMGMDEMSVVDSEARVHGIEGLRVIDASIMPDITNGNLNAPVIMMAEKLADVILGKQPLG